MIAKKVSIRSIFDSRDGETIEIEIRDQFGQSSIASVPSGKSRGANEASVISFSTAKRILAGPFGREISRRNFKTITSFDKFLLSYDPTPRKVKIGGNLALGLSIAFTRGLAEKNKQKVWQLLKAEFFKKDKSSPKTPYIFSNLINGGEHANNNLAFQEYMVVLLPSANPEKAISNLINLYQDLGTVLTKRIKTKNLALGDEGGYSLNFKNSLEPISVLEMMIRKEKYRGKFLMALDSAATSFKTNHGYDFDGHELGRNQLKEKYLEIFKNHKLLFSIEDPFQEKDYAGFKNLLASSRNRMVVGDDLTTTNPRYIEKFAKARFINSCIIKPNQIGTVSESCAAIIVARKNNVKTIISHRSGETEDVFIIHLAKASNAFGLKIGAPIKERMIKFNELIRLYAKK
ncbi:MAG: enolase [Parcubacteria group bacterium Gr01-1014_20]|nr:MAG: enolase [Parcubacteria group bacterium Gr01-1014_20]